SIRDMLNKERSAVISRMDSITHDALLVEFDGDGVPASSWGQDLALTDSLDARLATIEGALERLDEGSYGVCAECKSDIPPRRLHALPFATLCVQCQSLADKRARAVVH
ncbi:MAG TPA: TraR/DksA family transcriptional regulator, partial [Chloroflexota bacterium]|nr:TraR/DksA family transcriptional regulator [Chloroflexota bacterium]